MMKFLAVFFCMSLMISNANAEAFSYNPSHPCFKTLYDWGDEHESEYDITVYFDTAIPRENEKQNWLDGNGSSGKDGEKAGENLLDCIGELRTELSKIEADHSNLRIFMLATADGQGRRHNYNNDALSQRRLEVVKTLVKDVLGDVKILDDGRYAGAVNAGVNDSSNQDERAVRILVSYGITPIPDSIQTLVAATGTVRTERKINFEQDAATVARRNVYNASQLLNGILNRQDVSVWKNKDGGFNTSRLVSDSVAGVVLGTAGGLIVSNVVKKNQLNSGYENIRCTIGGQVVAGYGDEFVVGPR